MVCFFTSCMFNSFFDIIHVQALASNHLINSKKWLSIELVTYKNFGNSLIIHKEKTREMNVFMLTEVGGHCHVR